MIDNDDQTSDGKGRLKTQLLDKHFVIDEWARLQLDERELPLLHLADLPLLQALRLEIVRLEREKRSIAPSQNSLVPKFLVLEMLT